MKKDSFEMKSEHKRVVNHTPCYPSMTWANVTVDWPVTHQNQQIGKI